MRKTISILAFISLCISMWAVPARRMSRDLPLENGSVVRNAVLCGDEHFHYWEAEDGSQYVQTEDNTFRLLSRPEAGAHARKAATERAAMVGQLNLAPRGLVILANFKDVKFRAANTHAAMDSMLNGGTYLYHQSIGSARKYFQDQSKGQYNPIFDVVGPVELPDSMKYYGENSNSTNGSDRRAADMVLRACEGASRLPGVDFSRYDNNNDGMVDMVFVIYAGYGEADSQVDSLIWPASWTMGAAVSSGKTHLPPNTQVSAYTFNGKTIGYYAYTCELNYYNTIFRPTPGFSDENPLRAGIGVFCHEFSHVIGLPDYYDSQYSTNYMECLTPGNWDVMDQGSYNMDGYVPPSYSCHEKWWIGWKTPQLLNSPCNVELWADSTGYYLTRDGRAASSTTADTIYYLENRQQRGWDMGLPGHGMYVLRVVYNSSSWTGNVPNNTAYKPRYMYVAADETYTWNDGGNGLQGDAGDTYPGRDNVSICSLFPAYPITEISEQDEVIRFAFMGGDTLRPDTGTSTMLNPIAPIEMTEGVYSITGHYMGNTTEGCARGIYIVRKNGQSEKLIIQ